MNGRGSDRGDGGDRGGENDGDDEGVDATDAQRDASGDPSTAVDYLWVMRTTFVVTILVGAPVVALLSATVELSTWNDRVAFAIRVGAVVWFVAALGVYWHARRRDRSTRA